MRTVRSLSTVATLLLIIALSGCSTADSPVLLKAKGISREAPSKGAPVEDTVTGLQEFTEAFGAATHRNGENTAFSPVSMGYGFAMLRAGADGDSAAQLDSIFGFPETGLHRSFNLLGQSLVTDDGQHEKPALRIANGLFVQNGFPIADRFLRTLARHYGAGANGVDFASGEAEEVINHWVSEQTTERIGKLFDDLDPRTKAVLANAIYLNAKWKVPFEPVNTRDADFRRADGKTLRTKMMHHAQELAYVDGDGWHAAALPYAGDELAMWILVPTGEEIVHPQVTGAMLRELDAATTRPVDLAMPRWDFGADFPLLATLKKLGLTDLSDLSGIHPALELTDAIHRANITVAEEGTEAAAVTGGALTLSAPRRIDGPVTVRADRPFAFAITHMESGAPLFVGSIADPTN